MKKNTFSICNKRQDYKKLGENLFSLIKYMLHACNVYHGNADLIIFDFMEWNPEIKLTLRRAFPFHSVSILDEI